MTIECRQLGRMLPPVSQSPYEKVTPKISRKSSLLDLKSNRTNAEALNLVYWPWVLSNGFKSVEEFFQRLDVVHEDTLKAFKIRDLTICVDLIFYPNDPQRGGFLSSPYACLSNEEFLNLNGIFRYHSNLVHFENCVSVRLSYIFKHHKALVHPNGRYEDIDLAEGSKTRCLSLRQIQNLSSQAQIQKVYSKTGFSLAYLSVEQKMMITEEKLFHALMTHDTPFNKRKYLFRISSELLNDRLLKLSSQIFHNGLARVISALDLPRYSDLQIQALVFYEITEKLTALSKYPEKLEYLLRRLCEMVITTDTVTNTLKTIDGQSFTFKRKIPHYPPANFRFIDDVFFRTIPFSELSQEKLFCLFHPKSIHNDTKFGSIFLQNEEHLIQITQEIEEAYQARLCKSHLHNSITFIEQRVEQSNFSSPKKFAKLNAKEFTHDQYVAEVQKREDYNKHRLALLSREVYLEIRSKLDPEIASLGDKIFQCASTSESSRTST